MTSITLSSPTPSRAASRDFAAGHFTDSIPASLFWRLVRREAGTLLAVFVVLAIAVLA